MIVGTDSTFRRDNPGPVEDSELLRRYAEEGSNEAFAELVQRRIGLVYSVALRQARGHSHRAQDVTQLVFTDLASKAGSLWRRPVLAGWLYRSAQFAAAGLIRAELRRSAREQEAQRVENMFTNGEADPEWERVRPLLDEALSEMNARDRDAIVLRFFDGRAFAEIGGRLQLTENAARMRVERALDKLHAALARRGITSTTTALGLALGNQVGATMPAGLAATVTGTALTGSTGGWLAAFMSMSKLQFGIAGAAALAGATGYVFQDQTNDRLRREIAAVQPASVAIASLRDENQRLASTAAEVELLRRDDAELKQLASQIAEAQKSLAESARISRQRETERSVQAEIDRMNKEGNALVEEFKALTARSKDASLTADQRLESESAAKLKLAAIQAKQREIKAYIASTRGAAVTPESKFRALESQSAAAGASGKEQWTPAERVSLRIPQADPATVFSVYERLSGRKVIRDASVAEITSTFDLQTEPCTQPQMMQVLRAMLRDRLNIWVTPTPDGNAIATLGPPQ